MLMQCVLVWALHKLLTFDLVLHLFLTKEDTEQVSNYFRRWKLNWIKTPWNVTYRMRGFKTTKPIILLKTAFIQLCKYSNLFGKCVDYNLK